MFLILIVLNALYVAVALLVTVPVWFGKVPTTSVWVAAGLASTVFAANYLGVLYYAYQWTTGSDWKQAAVLAGLLLISALQDSPIKVTTKSQESR